jgi:hypothetical protein
LRPCPDHPATPVDAPCSLDRLRCPSASTRSHRRPSPVDDVTQRFGSCTAGHLDRARPGGTRQSAPVLVRFRRPVDRRNLDHPASLRRGTEWPVMSSTPVPPADPPSLAARLGRLSNARNHTAPGTWMAVAVTVRTVTLAGSRPVRDTASDSRFSGAGPLFLPDRHHPNGPTKEGQGLSRDPPGYPLQFAEIPSSARVFDNLTHSFPGVIPRPRKGTRQATRHGVGIDKVR